MAEAKRLETLTQGRADRRFPGLWCPDTIPQTWLEEVSGVASSKGLAVLHPSYCVGGPRASGFIYTGRV